MHFLVDGHNLIGQMPGISLSDEDDEAQLVMVLRRYATADRKRSVIIVFDHGVYGHPQRLDGYGITCYFARSPQDADTQLIKRIAAIERTAEWRVVTSDRVVARAAAERGIKVISSQTFAREVTGQPKQRQPDTSEKPRDVRLSQAEIDEWLRLFGAEPEEASIPEQPAPLPEPASTTKRHVHKKRVRKK